MASKTFSAYIKNELSKINNLKDKKEVLIELYGYLSTTNFVEEGKNCKYSTENEYNINRFAKLLNNTNINNYKILLQGNTYIIKLKKQNVFEEQEIKKELQNTQSENLKKAYVRGTFLGSGYITNPENDNHLEIILKNSTYAEIITNFLLEYEIKVNILKQKDKVSLYIKDGEEISKFLAFIGASLGVLKFEEIRVLKEMKNNVNRLVNCETSNLNKTINASVEQINTIKKLRKNKKFESLPEDLKEISILREENPNATLEELGKMLDKPIGKSAVNNRFKRIKEFL